MKAITFTDITLREESQRIDNALSFKEKIEIAKYLDRLNVDCIELAPLKDINTDTLLVKTVSSVVENSIISLPVSLNESSVEQSFNAIKNARSPRLVINVPVSPIQMAYTCQKKPPQVLDMIRDLVKKAKSLCSDVEFSADDASRSENDFLYEAIRTAISAGATMINISDTAGIMIPSEFKAFVNSLFENVPELKDVSLSVQCSNSLGVAAATSIEVLKFGVSNIKVINSSDSYTDLYTIGNIISNRGDALGYCCNLQFTEMQRTVSKIKRITDINEHSNTPYDTGTNEIGVHIALEKTASFEDVIRAVRSLGYDFSDEENNLIYDAFLNEASKKTIGAKELDAIISSSALQVPSTYVLKNYSVNTGNIMNASANIQLEKNGEILQGVSFGDGPIDSAFLAIEQIIGQHYELDEFQIQAVTEGREALGSTIVRLRSNGKLYPGNGISTDIIGASIKAYLSALNKIAYEEENN
ncbi:MAG: hypothetical protein IKI62_01155 [Clostridia bacterium]|nr:hypothetical protein [Clostridia bacterium]